MLNPEIKIIQIDQVNVDEPQMSKNGKEFFKVGISTPEGWLNNIFFENKHVDQIVNSQGGELEVVVYDEEYNGNMYKKFKLPTRLDRLEMRVIVLETRLNKAGALISGLIGADVQAKTPVTAEAPIQEEKTPPPPPPSDQYPGALPEDQQELGSEHEPDDLPF